MSRPSEPQDRRLKRSGATTGAPALASSVSGDAKSTVYTCGSPECAGAQHEVLNLAPFAIPIPCLHFNL